MEYMVSNKADRVLKVVGLILVLAVIGWISAASLFPSEAAQTTKYTTTGTSVGGISCCDKQNQQFSGNCAAKCGGCKGEQSKCGKRCTKNTPSSCQWR